MDARWSPMLCEPADTMPDDPESWVLEPKYDGWRALMLIEPTGVTVIGGRNNKTYTGQVPYIEAALRAALPANTVLDGELMHPAGWGSVQSAMTTKGGLPGLTFVAFDVLQVNGRDLRRLSYDHRRDVLEMIEWPEHTYLTPTGVADEATHVRMLDLGMEGSVVKRRDGAYMGGRRSSMWRKLKAIASEDCEIIGWEEGKNGRSGEIGALIVRLPSGVQTTVSGMTDKVRAEMLADWPAYEGQIVEVVHNGVMDSGKLRHPRYKRLRTDRTPVRATPKPANGKPRSGGSRMRNYKAMGDAKLLGCIRELENRTGDAYHRAQGDPNFSLDQHIAAARQAALSKGLINRI
jgi:ATP-dependent DNA ligase